MGFWVVIAFTFFLSITGFWCDEYYTAIFGLAVLELGSAGIAVGGGVNDGCGGGERGGGGREGRRGGEMGGRLATVVSAPPAPVLPPLRTHPPAPLSEVSGAVRRTLNGEGNQGNPCK